jgi:hypothetical protein
MAGGLVVEGGGGGRWVVKGLKRPAYNAKSLNFPLPLTIRISKRLNDA